MTVFAKKIKSFKKVFTKGEQAMIIIGALLTLAIGICAVVGGIQMINWGIAKIIEGVHTFLMETYGFGLY